MDDLKEKWVSGWLGTKREIWEFGWPAVGGYSGEGPAVVSRWWGGWMPEVGGSGYAYFGCLGR
jgi:hypothetical protein